MLCCLVVALQCFGCPHQSRDPAYRHQIRQHHVCWQDWPQGETDRLWACPLWRWSQTRDAHASGSVQVPLPPIVFCCFYIILCKHIESNSPADFSPSALVFPLQVSRNPPRPALQPRHWYVGMWLPSCVSLPPKPSLQSAHCLWDGESHTWARYATKLAHGSLTAARDLRLQMRQIVQLLGQPEDHLLCDGKYTALYFTRVEASGGPTWRLKVGLSSDFEKDRLAWF